MILMMSQLETIEMVIDENLPISIRKIKLSVHEQITIENMIVFRKSPEFRPKNSSQRRPDRRYRINENRTELIILQGDILRTKVDAIVNGLFFLFKRQKLIYILLFI